MASRELISAVEEIEKLKGIPKNKIIEGIKKGITSAYRKKYGAGEFFVDINEKSGELRLLVRKKVVEEVLDPALEISLTEALSFNPKLQIDDTLDIYLPIPKEFGRIAIQVARQIISQTVREGEREAIISSFAAREGDIILGQIWRSDAKGYYVKLSVGEGLLPNKEQGQEQYNMGDRLKIYILKVEQTRRDPVVIVSRSHPGLLRKIMEMEIPEIQQGQVEIVDIVREGGLRSKVAVRSRNDRIEPVGLCIGPKGHRIQSIIHELKGERIDIIKWSKDLKEYVTNSLSPAQVSRVEIVELSNPESTREKVARVFVSKTGNAKSVAIGSRGLNVHLAARLTGVKIDIIEEE